MDRRLSRQFFWIRVFLASLLVIIFYLVLANRASPDFTLWEVVKGVVKFFLLMWNRIPDGVLIFFRDIALFVLAYLFWLAFYAQFTLPVQNLGQRILSALYLIRYSLGMHGQAIRIENGKVPERYTKERQHRRGVIILDTASAALLRTKTRFTRSVGPGLVFTSNGEYIAGAADLHRRAWPNPSLGPRVEDISPFDPRDPQKETEEEFEARRKRRFETSGETRDGVEVVPNIFAVSRLDPDLPIPPHVNISHQNGWRGWLASCKQSSTRSRFGWNPEAVRLAITGEAMDPNVKRLGSDKRQIPWYELPAYLVVDLWREYLRRFTFEQLFQELGEYGGRTALQVIQDSVVQRLTMPYVDDIDAVGKIVPGRVVESREFGILQGRGIRLVAAPIRNLRFEKKVDQQIEDNWVSYWHLRAQEERDYLNRRRSYSMHEGEKAALREFAFQATRKFDSALLKSPKPTSENQHSQMRQALERLLRGTLGQCLQDTQVHQRLSGEESQLVSIIDWVRRQ
jgi:hypothetical protein